MQPMLEKKTASTAALAMLKATLLTMAWLGLAGCAALGGLAQKPEVQLTDLELTEFGLLEQRYLLRLRVINPNPVSLPLEGLTLSAEINGQPFARGVAAQPVLIPAHGQALVDVQASSSLASVLRQWRALQQAGREQMAYRIHGELTVGGLGRIPFDKLGDIPLPTVLDKVPGR